jgi:3-oxoadipate enol-lactonase
VFVAESGAGAKPAVLLLHALGLDHEMWHLQPAALTGDARLLMPDLPGFGRSHVEESGLDRSVDACAERLRLLPGGAVVVGISYGAYVAAMLAAKYPDLVSGLAISGVRRRVPRVLAALQAARFA